VLYVLLTFNIQKVFILPTKYLCFRMQTSDDKEESEEQGNVLYWGWGGGGGRQLLGGSQALPACPSHKGNMKMDEDDVRMLTVAG
jgi:hypothetical protein